MLQLCIFCFQLDQAFNGRETPKQRDAGIKAADQGVRADSDEKGKTGRFHPLWKALRPVPEVTDMDYRLDPAGNVVYRLAPPSGPLGWQLDHMFPWARGGLSVIENFSVLNSHANQTVKNDVLWHFIDVESLRTGFSAAQFLRHYNSGSFFGLDFNLLKGKSLSLAVQTGKDAELFAFLDSELDGLSNHAPMFKDVKLDWAGKIGSANKEHFLQQTHAYRNANVDTPQCRTRDLLEKKLVFKLTGSPYGTQQTLLGLAAAAAEKRAQDSQGIVSHGLSNCIDFLVFAFFDFAHVVFASCTGTWLSARCFFPKHKI